MGILASGYKKGKSKKGATPFKERDLPFPTATKSEKMDGVFAKLFGFCGLINQENEKGGDFALP